MTKALEKVGIASIGIVWLGHLAAAFRYPLGNDPAIFQYHGWALTVGEVPYRDSLDVNTPGIMLLHWIWGNIAGFNDTAFLVLVMGLSSIALWVAWHQIRTWVTPAAALLGLALALWAWVGITPWDRGQRELFQGLLLLSAAFLALRNRPLWAGVAAGVAITLKLTAGPIVALLWIMWHVTLRPGTRALCRAAVGILLPIAGVLVWLAAIGAWADYWWIQLHYLPHHRGQFTVPWTSAIQHPLVWITAVVGVGGAIRGGAARTLSVVPLAAIALYLLQRHGWTYHLHVAIPMLLPITSLCVSGRIPDKLALSLTIPAIVLATMVTIYDHGDGLIRGEKIDDHWDFVAHQLVAEYLNSEGDSNDRILTNNDEQQLLYLARRRGATRCLYSFLCSEAREEPIFQALATERLETVRKRPPQWVVWNTAPYSKSFDTLAVNPQLFAWISADCTEVPRIGPYRLWQCATSDK